MLNVPRGAGVRVHVERGARAAPGRVPGVAAGVNDPGLRATSSVKMGDDSWR